MGPEPQLFSSFIAVEYPGMSAKTSRDGHSWLRPRKDWGMRKPGLSVLMATVKLREGVVNG